MKSTTQVLACYYVLKRRLAAKTAGSRRTFHRSPAVKRTRKSVRKVHDELGKRIFRRAYRMTYPTFLRLLAIIKPYQSAECRGMGSRNYRHVTNGRIDFATRLACALRIFAGGDVPDIISTYGVSKTAVHDSVDFIIEAVNKCPSLAIKFPTDHDRQKKIADGFKAKSKVGFDICAGCIDGMLVWIEKPTDEECDFVKVGSKKFFCGRKSKFGLNLQATCDHEKRFLNISIKFPGATSDFLSFEGSEFRQLLETPGFLAQGLCIFGDNAYVNKFYMATPYPMTGPSSPKDNYNFYHSQLRINIECAFGILVQRWGILRKAMSSRFTIDKICRMVQCLCQLHNFLIDSRIDAAPPSNHTIEDQLNLELNGAIQLTRAIRQELGGRSVLLPSHLLNGGAHFDDDPDRTARRDTRGVILPRDAMYVCIQDGDFRRPPRRT